jgi:hypothetical protein
MHVSFVFEQDENHATLASLIGTLATLQRLWEFAKIIAGEPEYPEVSPRMEERKLELLFHQYYIGWGYVFAGLRTELEIARVRYGSSLEIDSTELHIPNAGISRLRKLFDVIIHLLTIDLVRDRARYETELARQRAIHAMLRNNEHMFELSKKIKDPVLRDEFIRRMVECIAPFSGESGLLKLKSVQFEEHRSQKTSTPVPG